MERAKYSAHIVACFVINYSQQINTPVTNLKLQKILYFIQAHFLTKFNRPCFIEDIEAWSLGPVVPSVYHEFKSYGAGFIPYISTKYPINAFGGRLVSRAGRISVELKPKEISFPDQSIIKLIVDKLSRYPASTLINITHNQAPWRNAYHHGKKTISNESIKNYFEIFCATRL
ncbi:MAG: DUF4065 domain-containing protein [Oscillospiraceae bacterium]|nr:DUF4065 domain-containing protein [Oscillospiraceae bacterium]